MPEIKITCPQCNQELQGDDTILGQEVQCPTCNQIFKAEVSTPKPPTVP